MNIRISKYSILIFRNEIKKKVIEIINSIEKKKFNKICWKSLEIYAKKLTQYIEEKKAL